MGRPFTFFSITVFLLVALAHAIRIWFVIPVTLAGEPVPLPASWAAIAVALVLALGLWYEMRRTGGDAERAEPSRGGKRGTRARPSVEWTDPVTGMRQPARYFLFSSAGVSPQAVYKSADQYGRILVGFDAGNIPASALSAARECNAELSIYVEGPGGPTGNAWAADESARVKAAAASVGVRTDDRNWMKEWDKWGWQAYTFRQLEGYRREGYAAAEIDNLDRVLCDANGERDPRKFIDFFKEYATRQSAGKLPRLVTKNLSEEQLARVVEAVADGQLPRTMFSEFHISEKGSGDRRKQDALSSKIGIRTVASNDTYNYDAKGEFGLEAQYAALFKPPASAPPPSPAAAPTPAAAPAPVAAPAPAPAAPPAAPHPAPASAPAPQSTGEILVATAAEAAQQKAARAKPPAGTS